jgi:glycosyltransferase involved in cell wall biosynthesis
MITIITTAFNNTEYIEECLDSILNSAKNIDFELLVGIDNCEKTLFKCFELKKKYPDNVKFLFFLDHVGTYIIRNTLASKAKYEKLLFFDSDDIMTEILVDNVNEGLNNYEHIRYNYSIFHGFFSESIKNDAKPGNHFHTGTFGILKKIFLNANGFEPWVCAADGEFYWRLTKNNIKSKDLKILGLYYRRHGNNLTISKKTSMGSPLRKMYHNLKEKKIANNISNPLPELKVSNFRVINEIDLIELNNLIKTNKKYEISVIVPTFNNTKYIDESLNSIINSSKNNDIEILVGIDGCENTLNHIKGKVYPDFIKFYYFETNNGPYDIKNSLTQISNSENLLFFDSDDVMTETTITEIVSNIGNYDMVRLKYKEIIDGKIQDDKENFHEGNFAIKKSIFLSMNGFEPWMCAADSDFLSRLYKKRPKIYHTKNLSVYYRRHNQSLTIRPDTGLASNLRGNYSKISKTKKGDGNPSILNTRPFESIIIDKFTLIKEYNPQLEIRNQKINSVLNKKDRKVVEAQPQKKQDPVVLDRLDFLYKNKSEEPRVIKTNKPNNRQELIDKKNGTTKNTIKEMFNIKPNHRDGKNFINIGGKSRI